MSFAPPKLMYIQASELLNKLGATVNAENFLPYSVLAHMTQFLCFSAIFSEYSADHIPMFVSNILLFQNTPVERPEDFILLAKTWI